MEKKYILTDETIGYLGHTLHRIQAVKDFADISAGMFGGYVEREDNLDHAGAAWLSENAKVSGDAWVSGAARVSGDAWVSGAARVFGDARVFGAARVSENARVFGAAWLSENAKVSGAARVFGDAWVSGAARVSGNAKVTGDADYTIVHGFGRYFRTTTFFRCNDGIVRCQCGCFYGSIEAFRANVRETHGNSKYAKEYLMIADLMELHFKED